jgi:hypothetical protein
MWKIMDYKHMTAPCGLPCFECPAHEQGLCKGCRNEKGKCGVNPMLCRVYPCAEEKGVTFCYECSDFPCDFLHPYADQAATKGHNLKVFNLCLIKKLGLEEWAMNKVKSVGEVYFSEKWKL